MISGLFADSSRFFDAIIALLVVANIVPILPIVLDVVQPLPRERRRAKLISALLVGNLVALAFALGGGVLLGSLHSDIDDIRVAGGVILLVFAIHDLLFSREQRKEALGEMVEDSRPSDSTEVGFTPLGVPLMVGAATLATVLTIAETYGVLTLLVAMILNFVVNAGILYVGQSTIDFLGPGVIRTIGKVFGLVLAALAVSMIRTGVSNMWNAG